MHTSVYYNLDSSLPETLESISGNNELKNKFGIVATEMILVNNDVPDYKVNQMLDEIEQIEGIDWTLSYSRISKAVPEQVLSEDLTKIFQSDKYKMVIINSKYEVATNELNSQMEEIQKVIDKYDPNAILAGEGPLMKDLIQVSDHDFNSVNTVSIEATVIPRPTSLGFTPPFSSVGFAAPAVCWLIIS